MKMMIARYNGTCAGCGTPIHAGDHIAFVGRGRAYHATCRPSDDRRADAQYYDGRAAGSRRSQERRIYGAALVERWDMEEELARYNAGLDD